MAETRLQSFFTEGSFTFTAITNGLHRFHVIGKGGDGATGNRGSTSGNGANGGFAYGGSGGAGGGYAIHEVLLQAGESVSVTIDQSRTVLSCKNVEVISMAGGVYTNGGIATGANVSNLKGGDGAYGASGYYSNDGTNFYGRSGVGGTGAASVGKYQANGGAGGAGAWRTADTHGGGSRGSASAGKSPVNTDTAIGGAGGGGGGGGGMSTPEAGGTAGKGAMGGVVIEFVNSAPTAPSYIDAGNVLVADKEAAISWGPSTDVDGNMAGYVLERSVDGGVWTETYRGAARNITDAISPNWTTVQYRVKVYDAEGAESGYISTEKLTVVHNSPPSAPGPISLPPEIHGGATITASWGRATDVDNNLTGYTLEQSVDGGEWTEIKNTAEITAQVPITYGWQTVQLRVRAYDSYGVVGEYSTSQVITVINNRNPIISGEDRDLGTMSDGFEPLTYVVSDEDGDMVTVDVRLDGVLKNTFTATLGTENPLELTPEEWRKVLNGPHTWTITATDSQQAAATRTITFTKAVTSIRFRLAEPLPADAMLEKIIMSFQGAAPEGSILTIEACNNAHDESPTWEDITSRVLTGQKHFFRNAEKTAEKWGVGIRVTLDRGSAVGECYIHSHRGNYA